MDDSSSNSNKGSDDIELIDEVSDLTKRISIRNQRAKIVICESLSDGVLVPNRSVDFPDLNYR